MVTPGYVPGTGQTPVSGASVGVNPIGTNVPMPSLWGNIFQRGGQQYQQRAAPASESTGHAGQRRGSARFQGEVSASGASTIYREQGKRLIAVKFSVRGRDLAGAVAEAQEKTAHLFKGLPGRMERRVSGDAGGGASPDVHHPPLPGGDFRSALPRLPRSSWTRSSFFSNVIDLSWAAYGRFC